MLANLRLRLTHSNVFATTARSRRGLVAVAATVALATAIPASALLLGGYNGHVVGQPNTTVAFELERTDSGRRVQNFIVSNIPYTCEGGGSGTTGQLVAEGGFRVRRGEFSGTREVIDSAQDPITVHGELRRGGLARGTLKVFGPLAGGGTDCTSGRLDWRAERDQTGPVRSSR